MTRRPAFTLLAILTLTIGVGANTAVFSLVNGVFLKPVPLVREPEQVVEVNRRAGGDILDVSYPVFRVMRDERGLLRDAAAYTAIPASLVAGDDTPVVRMILTTTGNYLTLLGARPAAGRFFMPDESFHPAAAAAVVISDRLWRERFGGRLDAIGRPLRVNGVPLTVVGVTPPAFRGHAPGSRWTPTCPSACVLPASRPPRRSMSREVAPFRSSPGSSLASPGRRRETR